MLNDVSPQILLAFFEDSWARAKNEANTFRDQLVSDQQQLLPLIRQGSIASVGKNSATQTYKSYGPGSITQVQTVEILSELIGFYDVLKDKITCEFTASADWNYGVPAAFDFDAPIYELLRKALSALCAGTATLLTDISALRLPGTFNTKTSPLSW